MPYVLLFGVANLGLLIFAPTWFLAEVVFVCAFGVVALVSDNLLNRR